MAIESYPFGAQKVTDEQYRRYARTYAGTAVHEGLTVSANSTGMNVQVAAGFATVQGLAFHNDATATVTISSNTAANPRIDTVVLRLTPGAGIAIAVVPGVPRANPVAPTLTQDDMGVFEFPLADVAVPSGAVSIPSTAITSRGFSAHAWARCEVDGEPSTVGTMHDLPLKIVAQSGGYVKYTSGNTWNIYIPESGVYLLSASGRVASSTGWVDIGIHVNYGAFNSSRASMATNLSITATTPIIPVQLAAGDHVGMYFWWSGSTPQISTGRLSIMRIA